MSAATRQVRSSIWSVATTAGFVLFLAADADPGGLSGLGGFAVGAGIIILLAVARAITAQIARGAVAQDRQASDSLVRRDESCPNCRRPY